MQDQWQTLKYSGHFVSLLHFVEESQIVIVFCAVWFPIHQQYCSCRKTLLAIL